MDVVRDGPADAPRRCCWSAAPATAWKASAARACRCTLLADAGAAPRRAMPAWPCCYMHALNPWGFSWWRRTTHENVDLNRNFHDFTPAAAGATRLRRDRHLLVPATWPPTPEADAGSPPTPAHGRALQAAISGGQYEHPEGLFYGGRNPTWSQQTLRHVLQDHGRAARAWAGSTCTPAWAPAGTASASSPAATMPPRWRVPAPGGGRRPSRRSTTAPRLGAAGRADVAGRLRRNARRPSTPASRWNTAPLPVAAVMDALRADQWLENHPQAGAAQREPIKRSTRDAFYTDTDTWKSRIVEQGRQAAAQALAGLWGAGAPAARRSSVQPGRCRPTGQPRQQVAAQRLAQLHAPLVEAVDAPQRAAGEHAVLVQRDQRAQRTRRQRVQHQRGARPVAGEAAVARHVSGSQRRLRRGGRLLASACLGALAQHQRLALRQAVGQQLGAGAGPAARGAGLS
jgi:hypothetical protein